MNLDIDDIVWAKMKGYPFWPSVITIDTTTGLFKKGNGSSAKFHVAFLGGEWVPAWIPQSFIREFKSEDTGPNRKKDYRVGPKWEIEHPVAMKAGLDKLLEKGGLTKTGKDLVEPNKPSQDCITQRDDLPTAGNEVVTPHKSSTLRENFKISTPEFILSSPDQEFFTPSQELSHHDRTEVSKLSEKSNLKNHEISKVTKNGLKSSSSKGKLTLKKKSVDANLRRSGRHSSTFVRDEPDLISSVQYDSDWKKPYKCRYCLSRFGWNLDRDSHEIICNGDADFESQNENKGGIGEEESLVGTLRMEADEHSEVKWENSMVKKTDKNVRTLGLYFFPLEQDNLVKVEVNFNEKPVHTNEDEHTEPKVKIANNDPELGILQNKYDMIKKKRLDLYSTNSNPMANDLIDITKLVNKRSYLDESRDSLDDNKRSDSSIVLKEFFRSCTTENDGEVACSEVDEYVGDVKGLKAGGVVDDRVHKADGKEEHVGDDKQREAGGSGTLPLVDEESNIASPKFRDKPVETFFTVSNNRPKLDVKETDDDALERKEDVERSKPSIGDVCAQVGGSRRNHFEEDQQIDIEQLVDKELGIKNDEEDTDNDLHIDIGQLVDKELGIQNDQKDEGNVFDPPISSSISYSKLCDLAEENKQNSTLKESDISTRKIKTKAELKEYYDNVREKEALDNTSQEQSHLKNPSLSKSKSFTLKTKSNSQFNMKDRISVHKVSTNSMRGTEEKNKCHSKTLGNISNKKSSKSSHDISDKPELCNKMLTIKNVKNKVESRESNVESNIKYFMQDVNDYCISNKKASQEKCSKSNSIKDQHSIKISSIESKHRKSSQKKHRENVVAKESNKTSSKTSSHKAFKEVSLSKRGGIGSNCNLKDLTKHRTNVQMPKIEEYKTKRFDNYKIPTKASIKKTVPGKITSKHEVKSMEKSIKVSKDSIKLQHDQMAGHRPGNKNKNVKKTKTSRKRQQDFDVDDSNASQIKLFNQEQKNSDKEDNKSNTLKIDNFAPLTRWSSSSSAASSPDADDRHWKRWKGRTTPIDSQQDKEDYLKEISTGEDEILSPQHKASVEENTFEIEISKKPKESDYPNVGGSGEMAIFDEKEMATTSKSCGKKEFSQNSERQHNVENIYEVKPDYNVGCCEKDEEEEHISNVYQEELPEYDVSTATLDQLASRNIFDSHCHLDFIFRRLKAPHRFNEGYLNVNLNTFSDFKRYYPKEIHKKFEGCVTNFCDPKQWNVLQVIPELIRALEKEPGIYYTVGCHPHFSESMMSSKSRDKLEGLIKWGKAKGGRCVALGECGLDLSINPKKRKTPLEAQKNVFKFQLKLAMKLNFPLVLHIREAEEEAYQVMQEVGLPPDHPIHRHCFNDSWAVCKTWMRKFPRSFIGLTNLLLKPNVKHLHEIARLIPLDRLILETDSPYFPPLQAHHQSRDYPRDMSHPGDVIHVAAQVAALRKDSLENVLAANRRNITTLYRIKEMPGKSRMDGRKC